MDPFNPAHPVLNHRDVDVIVYVAGRELPARGFDARRAIDWRRLTSEERLELERLLAKACS